jgi:DNA-binding response OmpR family regulator
MNALTLRLTGVVSERPAVVDPLHLELRALIDENDRLSERNANLKRERDAALDRVAELKAALKQERLRQALELRVVPLGSSPVDLIVGGLRLNYAAQRLEHDGRSAYLPRRPMELLSHLMGQPGAVMTTALLARTLGYSQDNHARELIRRTRGILAEIGARDYLRSHGPGPGYGSGYWVEVPS